MLGAELTHSSYDPDTKPQTYRATAAMHVRWQDVCKRAMMAALPIDVPRTCGSFEPELDQEGSNPTTVWMTRSLASIAADFDPATSRPSRRVYGLEGVCRAFVSRVTDAVLAEVSGMADGLWSRCYSH